VKGKWWIAAAAAVVLVAVLLIWALWANSALELNTYVVTSGALPSSFDGYRIAHVSDLHNAEMGEGNEKLLTMLREAEPDLIAITGDLIDSRRTDVDIAAKFVQEAVKIAPCFYVTGNHESRVAEYGPLKEAMEAAGVTVLEDERAQIAMNEETITLVGVQDPSFQPDTDDAEAVDAALEELITQEDGFVVLLSHRPELFDTYVEYGMDLVLSGHAHGGQFRLPFVGGLVAPNQGFFPEYDSGLYTEDGTNMIVSRGIGNSIVPFRFNNRPEIILIELESLKGMELLLDTGGD